MSLQFIAQGGAAVGQMLTALVDALQAATGNEVAKLIGSALADLLA